MDERLIELYVQRGRLRERVSVQRREAARALTPISDALRALDRTHAQFRQSQGWLAAHPAVVAAAAVALLVWRPRSVVTAARWGYLVWRRWTRLKRWLGPVG